MIVCLCRAVSDKKVLAVVQEGAASVREVTAKCGAGGDCGACRASIAGVIMEHHRTHPHPPTSSAAGEEQCSTACSTVATPVVEAAA